MPGAARAIEDMSAGGKEADDVVERRRELDGGQLVIRDKPLVHLGKRVIARHNLYLRRAPATKWQPVPQYSSLEHRTLPERVRPFMPLNGMAAFRLVMP